MEASRKHISITRGKDISTDMYLMELSIWKSEKFDSWNQHGQTRFQFLDEKHDIPQNWTTQSVRFCLMHCNKTNLRDLIAATGLIILLKLDLNRRLFSPCDLEIWWMTPKNNRAPLLCYFELFASFRSHWGIQTGVRVRKRPIWVKFNAFFSRVTLKFDGWHWQTIGHLFYPTSSFVQHFVAIGEFKLELQSGNGKSGSNSTIFRVVLPWNLTDDLQKQ